MIISLVRLELSLVAAAILCFSVACSNGPIRPIDANADADADIDAQTDADAQADADANTDADPDAVDDADVAFDGDLDGDEDGDDDLPDCPDEWDSILEDPREVTLSETFTGEFPRCATAQRFAVIPRGMEALLELGDLPSGSLVSVESLDGEVLGSEYATTGEAILTFSPSRSGEVRLVIYRPDGKRTPSYSGRLTCLEGCDLEATRYPIVLCHGMAGTDYYAGFLGYFYRVPERLRELGYQVHTPVVEAIGPSSARAEALAPQIDEILDESGAPKVHLFGHSQGGLDIRVLVSGLGYDDRAATMTTFATPHRGIRVDLPDWLTGQDFTEDFMTGEFDATYPDVETIPRFSWTGESCPILDIVCQGRIDGEMVDPLFSITIHIVQDAHSDDRYEGANDGLVPIASAQWGEFLGIVYADHMDEVGQLADDPDDGPFRHIDFFISEARRLRRAELELGL